MKGNRFSAEVTLAFLVASVTARPASAQFAVIDVAAIVQEVQQVEQLTQQVETARQQLSTAQEALTQARAQLQALSGTRGMQSLLSGIPRNYLPQNAADLTALLSGSASGFGALSAQVEAGAAANAVLPDTVLSHLTAFERDGVLAARRRAALEQGISAQALTAASDRFASWQTLIDAIGTASDPKAILDLQARIEAEQGMLANEQVKEAVLTRSVAAEADIRRQQRREQAVLDIGSLRDLPPMGLTPPAP